MTDIQAPVNPEIGEEVTVDGVRVNYHDRGSGDPVILIHGSGPGVSGWANWRGTIPTLSESFRVLAPDMLGFGYTERPAGVEYSTSTWVSQLLGFMDALGISKASIVGNSFGGGLALAMAVHHPQRVDKLVLMGSSGVAFELTPGLDQVWGYEPSLESMKHLLDLFAYDRSLVNDELADMRFRASIRPGVQEAYAQMFPAPRQRWVDSLALPENSLRAAKHSTLIIHGREDLVVPPSTSQRLFELLPVAQLHLFGQCGHWTQIEYAAEFNKLVADFLLNPR